jgi:beta-alanine--pyruvate transaminase
MGAVFVRRGIFDSVVGATSQGIEFFHGYTYSGHPLAAAAALGALDVYEQEGLFTRAAELGKYWEEAAHSLRDLPRVIDVRNIGLVAGIELESRADAPGARAYDAFVECFNQGVLIRVTGDTIALSPPLIIERAQVDRIFDVIRQVVRRVA